MLRHTISLPRNKRQSAVPESRDCTKTYLFSSSNAPSSQSIIPAVLTLSSLPGPPTCRNVFSKPVQARHAREDEHTATPQAKQKPYGTASFILREGSDTVFQQGRGVRWGGGGDSVCSSEEFALQTILQKLAGRTNYVDIKSKQNLLRLKD